MATRQTAKRRRKRTDAEELARILGIEVDAGALQVADLRRSLGLTRKVFSRLTGYSERALAAWETGQELSGAARQRMIELQRLQQGLAGIMRAGYIGTWLQKPNEGFGGLKPIEVIERGESDRLWRTIYWVASGQPG